VASEPPTAFSHSTKTPLSLASLVGLSCRLLLSSSLDDSSGSNSGPASYSTFSASMLGRGNRNSAELWLFISFFSLDTLAIDKIDKNDTILVQN
jgi:hypothetical protein